MRKAWYSYCTDGGQFFSGVDTIDSLTKIATERSLNISLWSCDPDSADAMPAGLITEDGSYYDESDLFSL